MPEAPPNAETWLQRCSSASADAPPATLWACINDGLTLQGTTAEETAELRQRLLTTLLRLNLEVMLPACELQPAAMRGHLGTALAALEQRYLALDHEAAADNANTEAELHHLTLRLWILHTIAVVLDDGTPAPWDDLLLYLEGLRSHTRDDSSGSPAQQMELDQIMLAALITQARSCIGQLQSLQAGLPGDDDCDNTCGIARQINTLQRCRHLGTLLLDGLTRCTPHPALDRRASPEHDHSDVVSDAQQVLSGLQQAQKTLLEQIVTRINALPEEQAIEILQRRSVAIVDFAADTLSDISDRPIAIQATVLKAGYEQLRHFRSALIEPRKQRLDQQRSRVRRVERRMHSEWVEAGVSAELARRFGPRFERRLDLMVLVLVLAAIGILVVDLGGDLGPTGVRNVILTDTAICFALLSDFLLRLHCAPDRRNFFRRHWLTDLLPAFPFAGLGYWLSSLAIEAQGVTVLRLLRVFAVALRKARPLIQVARIFLFAVRGMDRLVRRYRHLLNWDILFFEPRPLNTIESLRVRGERLSRSIRARDHALRQLLPAGQQQQALQRDLRLAAQLSQALTQVELPPPPPPAPSVTRQIAVETVIDRLTHTDPWEIAEVLGADFPRRLAKLEWIARIPPLRWLPGFSDVVKARNDADNDLEFAEELARRLGSRLQSLNDKVLFLSDMHGIITAPQFIDRIGTTLVKSMIRPRNRLLMFGVGFIIVTALVEVLPFEFLEAAAQWLRKTLGWPILILGFIAFGAVWFGNRLRTLARTNTDFYTRIAEAKSINLLGDVKRAHAAEDQELLARRVLRPEARIRGRDIDADGDHHWRDDKVTAHFRKLVLDVFGRDEHGNAGSLAERVYLLYRDYLRGAHFDRGNTHTTDHLLGSPALLNLRHRILRLDPQQQQALESLDLRQATGMSGPSLWLRFVTHAMTQRVGQLVEEYNRHAIPLNKRDDRFQAADELQHFNAWLRHKQGHSSPDDRNDAPMDPAQHYATTTFNALDFLSNDPGRDSAISQRFGEPVLALVRNDRRRLIREVFGIPAIHRRDPLKRSFNPLKMYNRHLSRGRVFLLPLALLVLIFKGVALGFRWFRKTLGELRNPEPLPAADHSESFSDLRIALRKVHRMRKPVFLATTELRARLDVEYLGLYLPGEQQGTLEGSTVFEDLDMIGATPEEHADYQRMANQRREQMAALQRFLQQHQLLGDDLQQRLSSLFPNQPEHRRLEVMRALSSAHAANYDDLRDLISGGPLLRQRVTGAIDAQGRQHSPGGLKRSVIRLIKREQTRQAEAEFEQWWQNHGQQLIPAGTNPKKARTWVRRWWLADHQGIARLIHALSGLDQPAEDIAVNILEAVMRNVASWTEQLVTLRTVQALTILDIQSTTHIVRGLGHYEDDHDEAPEVRVTML